MTDTKYTPAVGDVVTFPRAPSTRNRERRYTVIDVRPTTWGNGTAVTYRPSWEQSWSPVMDYTDSLNTLRELGITLADQADA